MALARIDPQSEGIVADIGVSSFNPMPTNSSVLKKEYSQTLSLNDVRQYAAGDTIQWRISPLSGQAYVPSESFAKIDFYIQKQQANVLTYDGLLTLPNTTGRNQAAVHNGLAGGAMTTLCEPLDQIAPNYGFPDVGMFKEARVSYNNTDMNEVYDMQQQAELSMALTQDSGLQKSAELGWAKDDYQPGSVCVPFVAHACPDAMGLGAADANEFSGSFRFYVRNDMLVDAGLDAQRSGALGAGAIYPGRKVRLRIANTHALNGGAGITAAQQQQLINSCLLSNQGSATSTTAAFIAGAANHGRAIVSTAIDAASKNGVFEVTNANFCRDISTVAVAPNPGVGGNGNLGDNGNNGVSFRLPKFDDLFIAAEASGGPAMTIAATAGGGGYITGELILLTDQDDGAAGGGRDLMLAMSRPLHKLPLGQNKGALERRAYYLGGTANVVNNGSNVDQYRKFSVFYRFPTVGAFSGCHYLPDQTQIITSIKLNDKDKMFTDWSQDGVALANIDIKLLKATMYMKVVTLAPAIEQGIAAQFAQGDLVRINCMQSRQYTSRFEVGSQDLSLRSMLVGTGRPYRLLIWSALTDSIVGVPKRGKSAVDLDWGSSDATNTVQVGGAAGPIDFGGQSVKTFYALVNGVTYPAQRLEMSTILTRDEYSQIAANDGGAQLQTDLSEAYDAYREVCADRAAPMLTQRDFAARQLYVVDLLQTDDPAVADPTQTSVSIEVRIQLAKAISQPRTVGVVGLYQSVCTVDAQRQYTNDMA